MFVTSRPGTPSLVIEPETDSPRGGRPRDDAREQAIIDATVEIIGQVGYEAMSVEGVAVRAKSSKATIYRRWSGKSELMAEVIRRMHQADSPDPEDTGSLRGDLLALSMSMFEQMKGIDGGLLCGMAVAVRSDAELGRVVDAQKREQRDRIHSLILSRARARGDMAVETEPPALIDVAAGVSLFQIMSGKPLDREFAEYLVDRILIPLTR